MRRLFATSILGLGAGFLAFACGDTGDSCTDTLTCGSPSDASAGGSNAGGSWSVGGEPGSGGARGGGGSSAGGKPATGGSSGAAGSGGKGTSGTGGGAADGGADAGPVEGGAEADVEPPCDPTGDPTLSECLISDDFAVFVAPAAAGDGAAGTRASPVPTIGEGIALARAAGKLVIVCNAAYDEHVAITGTGGAVRVYGGFGCPGKASEWTPDATTHARIVPTTPGFGIDIANVTDPVVISAIDVDMPDARGNGVSSIAGRVINSTGVTFVGMTLSAGKGANGADGANGEKGADGAVAGDEQNGKAGVCQNPDTRLLGGEWSGLSTCGSFGGIGGDAVLNSASRPGDDGAPIDNIATPGMGVGGPAGTEAGKSAGSGGEGSSGVDGAVGIKAATAGTFTSAGFSSADGNGGKDGTTGQGGGGGGASLSAGGCIGASGGAGGMGGCGGGKAAGGKGGGASIALLVWDSAVAFETVSLISKDGGKGGVGGDGGGPGFGRVGGVGGDPDQMGKVGGGGLGGRGGNGGLGGAGSGGTGGSSYALVHHGAAPTGTSSFTAGDGGGAGRGGTAGLTSAPNGSAGLSGDTFPVP